jgi:crotonobetainyl-CoA:carnitine CoA-transferase CaiB-like acyl-CoA transferase
VQLLQKLRILELASVLAGPSVGQFFAELGAEVIKVENENGGDVTRSWKMAGEKTDDRSAYFCAVNWGKKSIALNLHTKRGKEIVHALAAQADVIIASYKPGDAEKLGVDYNTIANLNPSVVYGQITGYGSRDDRVGYDAVIQAESGFMYMNGVPGGSSLKMPVALVDVLAAHQLKEAILVALINRQITGMGDCVEVSLVQSAVASLVNQATNWLMNHVSPEKKGSAHPNIAPYGDVFHTQDGKEILFAVGNDRQFEDLCRVLDKVEAIEDPRFRNNTDRVKNREMLNAILREAMLRWPAHELVTALHKKKVPVGIIQTVPEALAMEASASLILAAHECYGVRNFTGLSIRSQHAPFLLPPPLLGEHTGEIINSLTI